MSSCIRLRTRHLSQRRWSKLLVLAHIVGSTLGLFGGCGEDSEPTVATTRSAEHVIDVTISPGESPKLLSASAERFASAQPLPVRFGNALLVQRDAQDQIVDRTFIELSREAVAFGFDRQRGIRCPCATKAVDFVVARLPRARSATRLELWSPQGKREGELTLPEISSAATIATYTETKKAKHVEKAGTASVRCIDQGPRSLEGPAVSDAAELAAAFPTVVFEGLDGASADELSLLTVVLSQLPPGLLSALRSLTVAPGGSEAELRCTIGSVSLSGQYKTVGVGALLEAVGACAAWAWVAPRLSEHSYSEPHVEAARGAGLAEVADVAGAVLPTELASARPLGVVTDVQGTPLSLITAGGTAVWQRPRTPYFRGKAQTDPDGDGVHLHVSLGAPGQVDDRAELGLPEAAPIYHGARLYDARAGQFLSPDPVALLRPDLARPQRQAPYTYAANDPLLHTDRSGLAIDIAADVGFILWDLYKLATDPCDRAGNLMALGADIAGAILPVVTGLGAAVRAGRGAARGAPKLLPAARYAPKTFAGGQLEAHFAKHAGEWGAGNITQTAYLKRAQSLLGRDVGGDILGAARANSDVLRYNVRTNEFAVGAADGTIRTLFRPQDGMSYWLKQVGP